MARTTPPAAQLAAVEFGGDDGQVLEVNRYTFEHAHSDTIFPSERHEPPANVAGGSFTLREQEKEFWDKGSERSDR